MPPRPCAFPHGLGGIVVSISTGATRGASMSRFWRVFAVWFAVLMAAFVLANLAGVIRPMGLKPFRFSGFPFTVAAWGVGVELFFDWSALALNAVVAVGVCTPVSLLCAWARTRHVAAPPAGNPTR
jgi:hypothetical protein